MNGDGAYEDEMKEIAMFESALRVAVPTRPDPGLGRDLVPRLAQAARHSTLQAEQSAARRRPHSRIALVARVGIAVALIPLVLAGLAFAGVTVPGPTRPHVWYHYRLPKPILRSEPGTCFKAFATDYRARSGSCTLCWDSWR